MDIFLLHCCGPKMTCAVQPMLKDEDNKTDDDEQ